MTDNFYFFLLTVANALYTMRMSKSKFLMTYNYFWLKIWSSETTTNLFIFFIFLLLKVDWVEFEGW